MTSNLRKKFVRIGIVLGLLILSCSYLAVDYASDYYSFPAVLKKAANKLYYQDMFASGDFIQSVSKQIDNTPVYYKNEFSPKNWPTVGPSISHASTIDADNKITIVSSTEELKDVLKNAIPGETILVSNGDYYLESRNIRLSQSTPSKHAPITLTAQTPGKVSLYMDTIEGIYVDKPNWTISGLRFIGTCKNHDKCEHAIHVVGNASNTTIANNEFIDFNAAIKVNAINTTYPDNGVIKNNHFYSTQPRKTASPVTPVNIDLASSWLISHNIIRDFIKKNGNKVSYGAYVKGGSTESIFENNLVLCNTSQTRYDGSQVGLSIGGGGMTNRRNKASYEADNTIVRNNIVLHCNDVGIYVNRGKNSLVNNNTLYNTWGIDVRFPETSAIVVNNLFSGQLKERDNSLLLIDSGNLIFPRRFFDNSDKLNAFFRSADLGNFTFSSQSLDINSTAVPYPTSNRIATDFCGKEISKSDQFIGAFSEKSGCFEFLD